MSEIFLKYVRHILKYVPCIFYLLPCLGNHSIVYYASWMDYYRDTPPYKHTTVWHMARVDKNLYYTDAVKVLRETPCRPWKSQSRC